MNSLDFKLHNLNKAYTKLCAACDLYDGVNEFMRDSVIQRFEFTYELCHKTLQEFMKHMGITLDNSFPRTIFRKAYVNNLIDDDRLWLKLMEDRNGTSHIYSENMSDAVAERIKTQYVPAIGNLIKNIQSNIL